MSHSRLLNCYIVRVESFDFHNEMAIEAWEEALPQSLITATRDRFHQLRVLGLVDMPVMWTELNTLLSLVEKYHETYDQHLYKNIVDRAENNLNAMDEEIVMDALVMGVDWSRADGSVVIL